MKRSLRLLAPLAAAAVPLMMMPMAAHADTGTTYQTTLNAINGSGGSGSFTMTVNGNQATVDESFSGLADQFNGAAYPHVQHIHIGAQGTCPTMDADQNGDGVISTTEGAPSYGGIGVTLSTKGDTSPAAGTDLKVAPAGGSVDYHRTFTLDSKTMSALEAGTGVIVVHGLDPATLSQEAQDAKSDLVPSLPLAATSPALCGALTSMPTGGVATGTGSTSGIEDSGLLALGGGLLVAGGVLFSTRKRSTVNAG
ncbi:hypothetical protein H9L09_14485 [Nocardioides mesophilus]|uniref:CHRD domain-containing protein n=2 Tax=Nocardioides mesophilus TaxID=433659 RepID=A0A7G9R829_9ACTN|nr:hypothetical protein H9L09_14485 [Nocardioides mesophilus]